MTRGAKTTGSRADLEGHAEAYVHTAPSTVASSLLDISSPLFLFGRVAGEAGDPGGGNSSLSKSKSTAVGGPSRAYGSGAGAGDDLAPLVIGRVNESEIQVLHYRRARGIAGEVIVELVSRVVREEGGGSSVDTLGDSDTKSVVLLVVFEPVDEAALEEEAAKKVAEKRARVRQTFKTVPAEEQGFFMMVRLTSAGSKKGVCRNGEQGAVCKAGAFPPSATNVLTLTEASAITD